MARKKIKQSRRPTRFTIILVSMIALIVSGVGFAGVSAITPVNSDHIVFQAPLNIYIKSIKTPDGQLHFASQSIKGGKTAPVLGSSEPTITVEKDALITLHFINEERATTNSLGKHNINIDEFNVHSEDLHYFGTQSITFLVDKKGTFDYYCSIHPEMRGSLVVE